MIDIQTLREAVAYNPETGELTWKERPESHFASNIIFRRWNTRYAGTKAFTATNRGGYHHGSVNKVTLYAHRVAFALRHGRWPSEQIDHVNGDRTDNRAENLREVSNSENHRNRPARKDMDSDAVFGVSRSANGTRWKVQIGAGKNKYLGTFDTKAEAIAARKAAEKRLGFHENHGRAA